MEPEPQNKPKTGGRWQKGQSGNPGGRPKSARFAQACRDRLAQVVPDDPHAHTYAEAIAAVLAEKALKGDVRAAEMLRDSGEGRPLQSVQFGNSGNFDEVFSRMTVAELETFAESGVMPAWATEGENEEVEREAK